MGVIVVEASLKSGALITARAGLEQGREVMAIPGKVDSPISSGSHRLIKEGAKLVETIEDVMEALGYIGQGLKGHAGDVAKQVKSEIEAPGLDISKLNLSEDEQVIYNCLDGDGLHIEEIITKTGLSAGAVNSGLISLRLKGLLRQLPGNIFRKN